MAPYMTPHFSPYMAPYMVPYMAPYMVPYMAPYMVSYMAPYMAPYMTPHGIQVGRGGVGWDVSKSMGSLRGGAPHKLAGGGCLGGGGRQHSPRRKNLPLFLYMHISKYPCTHININSHQSGFRFKTYAQPNKCKNNLRN